MAGDFCEFMKKYPDFVEQYHCLHDSTPRHSPSESLPSTNGFCGDFSPKELNNHSTAHSKKQDWKLLSSQPVTLSVYVCVCMWDVMMNDKLSPNLHLGFSRSSFENLLIIYFFISFKSLSLSSKLFFLTLMERKPVIQCLVFLRERAFNTCHI